MSTLVTIYWLCFGVGLVYMVVMGTLGLIGGGIEAHDSEVDLDHDFDHEFDTGIDVDVDVDTEVELEPEFELDAGADVDTDTDVGSVLPEHDIGTGHAAGHGSYSGGLSTYNPLSLTSLMAMLAAFGCGGLIAVGNGLSLLPGLLVALASGGLISFLFYLFIGKLLYSMQGTSEASQADMIGLEAEVLVPFEDEISGEIAYTLEGVRYTAPARLVQKGHAERREKVRIKGIKDNIVYVEPKKKLLA